MKYMGGYNIQWGCVNNNIQTNAFSDCHTRSKLVLVLDILLDKNTVFCKQYTHYKYITVKITSSETWQYC